MDKQLTKIDCKSKLVCRLCLNTLLLECAIAIFENKDNSSDLQAMVSKYLELEVSIDDTISTSICHDCLDHLEDFHQFYRNVGQKQKLLQKNIFHFLEVQCVTVEDEDVDKTDEIPVQDFLHAVQREQVANEDLTSNNKIDEDISAEDDQISDLKHEDIDYSSDDNKPLTELYADPDKNPNAEMRSLQREIRDLGNKMKTKRTKSKDSNPTFKKHCMQTSILSDCELNCDECNKEIGNFYELKKHFARNHRFKKTFVTCCGRKYTNAKTIAMHLYSHRDPDKFRCSICNKQLFSTKYLKKHIKLKHENTKEVEPMKCSLCDREFKFLKPFKKHMMHHENGEIKEKSAGAVECNQCSKSFISEARLKHHQKLKHATILPYQCNACEESFMTKSEEDNHRTNCRNRALAQSAVKGLISQTDNSQEAICQICCKIFPTISRLRAHIASMHENVHKYICDQCGKKFKLKSSFQKHLLVHQGIVEPPVQCETCGHWLKNRDCLRIHRYRHDNSVNKCSVCEHIAPTRMALRVHVKKVHRSEHNFHCQYCEKSFKNSTYLTEHMAIHTGTQLYACPHCGKESRSRSNMYAHVKRMHPEEWLKKQLSRSNNPNDKSQLIKLQ